MASYCTGCGNSFTPSGYWSHLTQSHNPSCKAILEEQLIGVYSDSDDSSCDDTSPSLSDYAAGFTFDRLDEDGAEDGEKVKSDDESMEVDVEDGNESTEDEDQRRMDYMLETSWEQPRSTEYCSQGSGSGTECNEDDGTQDSSLDNASRLSAEQRVQECAARVIRYSSTYPHSRAGAIVSYAYQSVDDLYSGGLGSHRNPWAPFTSEIDWKVGHWAKMRGPGSTAFSELLAINGVGEALNLSYKNTEELNKIIDSSLPPRPSFKRHEVVIAGESYEFYAKDIVECLKALWADPDFLPFLVFEPEKHYADDDHTVRLFHDMHTSKWWWDTQQQVERTTKKSGITIIPIIISSDKTQLTIFRNKVAYPVYFTIGNLSKHIRRKPSRQGQILLAYLPTSKLPHIQNKAARRRAVMNLFHACMGFLLKPLENLGLSGILLESGDRAVRDCHPIFAADCCDYPEQTLVTCIKTGQCPTCPVPRNEMGNPEAVGKPRQLAPILEALESITEGPTALSQACKNVGIKPIQRPFWQFLPFLNIFRSITPDVLHQLYQGNIKHLVAWIQQACGDAEIDARCRRLPPNHNIRLFLKGISNLSRVTGTEHDQMCRFLLGLIVDIRIPNARSGATGQLVRAVRGLLDFLYLARYPVHTTETLDAMERALQLYHKNRQVFIDLGIRNDFNFPKDHFLNHFRELIEYFGTTDNFNTEYTERLHIDLVKEAFRSTNSKDEYPQMAAWLDRRERMQLHMKFIQRRFSQANTISLPPRIPCLVPPREMKIAHRPSVYGVSLEDIKVHYGAINFNGALARYVIHCQNPGFSQHQVENAAANFYIPFHKVSVFHRIKFVSHDPFSIDPFANIVVDSIHCEASRLNKHGTYVPGRFDTAIIKIEIGGLTRAGMKSYCVGQVRCIFTLPSAAQKLWFPGQGQAIAHLAYVDWFAPFCSVRPGRDHGLYKISRRIIDGKQRSSIIPLNLIHQSVHLIPAFGPVAPVNWTSSNVLEMASEFYVNSFSDRFPYSTIY